MKLKSLFESEDHFVTVQLVNEKRKNVGQAINKVKIFDMGDGEYKFSPSGLKAISDEIGDKPYQVVEYNFEGKNVVRDENDKIIAVIIELEKKESDSEEPKPKKEEKEKKPAEKPKLKKQEIKTQPKKQKEEAGFNLGSSYI